MAMTTHDVRDLQNALNVFTKHRLAYVEPLIVDGDFGQATRKRIIFVKYYLGFLADNRKGASVTKEFLQRLHHPRTVKYYGAKTLARALARRAQQRRKARKDHKKLANAKGFGTFDGKTVAAWMVPWLEKSRAHGWRGTVASGVRTPAYSEHLCIAMCGHPTCPGKCAGRSSNHNMLPSQGKPFGAVDVTDYINFGQIQHRIGSPLRNDLPVDRVHFSVSGH